MKIIHIVENLDRGAVENWLVNCFIESKKFKPAYDWTFYCILGKPGRLDEEVLRHGGKIIYSPVDISNKIAFLKCLRKELIKGKYDIIHSHHDYMSGFYLFATIGIGFKKRLLHVHNTDTGLPTGNKIAEWVFLKVFWLSGYLLSDKIICISKDVLFHYLGKNRRKKGWLLYYGIDLKRFQGSLTGSIRDELKIAKEDKLILYTGRLNVLKNPVFCIDILSKVLQQNSKFQLVIVGKGEQEAEIINKTKHYGIEDHVHLIGWRNDIPSLMKSADLFLFPRIEYPKEGLGIVMIEAQAAGLPSLISNGIVPDSFVVEELINVLPLQNNPEDWASTVIQIVFKNKMDQEVALDLMERSVFSLENGTRNLLAFYE